MPTYEYECPLGHQFELVCSISAHSRTTECPECAASAVQVFRTPPRSTKINSKEDLTAALKKRSSEHSRKQASNNVERILAGETGGNSLYSPKAQERALRTRGVKID